MAKQTIPDVDPTTEDSTAKPMPIAFNQVRAVVDGETFNPHARPYFLLALYLMGDPSRVSFTDATGAPLDGRVIEWKGAEPMLSDLLGGATLRSMRHQVASPWLDIVFQQHRLRLDLAVSKEFEEA